MSCGRIPQGADVMTRSFPEGGFYSLFPEKAVFYFSEHRISRVSGPVAADLGVALPGHCAGQKIETLHKRVFAIFPADFEHCP